MIQKLIKILEQGTVLPCGKNDCDCNNCEDEITENGKTCQQKAISEALKLLKRIGDE